MATPIPVNKKDPKYSMLRSYLNLRAAIGLLAIALPISVSVVGWLTGEPIRTSISSYYHYAFTRDVFVASLFAIGVFLICYSGYDYKDWRRNEVWLHRFMGMAAILVGMCPTFQNKVTVGNYLIFLSHVHIGAAVILMVLMAVMALWMFPLNQELTKLDEDEQVAAAKKECNAWVYRGCGFVIAAVLIFYGLYFLIARPGKTDTTLFYVEWIAIWGFGVAWLWKSHLLSVVVKSISDRFAAPSKK